MSGSGRTGVVGELIRFLVGVVLLGTLLGVIGYWPTVRLAGPGGVSAMMAAILIVVLASMVGAVPVHFAHRAGRPLPEVALASMLARLGAVGLLALAVALLWGPPLEPLLIWLGIGYVALLVPDTLYAIRALGSL